MLLINFALQGYAYKLAWENFESGVADLLCVKALRHGTDLKNNLGIRLKGADPSHGGKATGSTHNSMVTEDTRGYFYVFKEQYNPLACLQISFFTTAHAHRSSHNQMLALFYPKGKVMPEDSLIDEIVDLPKRIFTALYICIGDLLPSISFHFSSLEWKRFEEDKLYYGWAYKTQQAIEPWRIGIRGAILTGCNLDWFSRLAKDPLKIVSGITKIYCSVLIVNSLKSLNK